MAKFDETKFTVLDQDEVIISVHDTKEQAVAAYTALWGEDAFPLMGGGLIVDPQWAATLNHIAANR